MKYYNIPIVFNQGLQVNALDMVYMDAISYHIADSTHGIAIFSDAYTPKSSWTEITSTDYQNYFAPTLDQAKQDRIASLQSSYFSSFTTFQSSALGTVKNYPINEEAQQNMRDYQQRAILDTTKNSFYFKTVEDGTLVNHTRTQFVQLMQDAETFKVNQTTHYDNLVSQVNAATTKDAVNAITW